MLKVIDLDSGAGAREKDRDAYIFTLTVAGEKVGVTEDELAELIRSKIGGQKGGKKGGRKAQGAADEHEATANHEFDSGEKPSASWLGKPAPAAGLDGDLPS